MNKTDSKALNILIAEDEKAYCHALVLKLKNAGFNAVGVSDGNEAMEALKKEEFDLLILDLVMPQMSGFEVLEEMNNLKIKLPTMIISNLTQSEDKKKVSDLGVKDFIEKADTSLVDIVNRIKELLQ